MSNDAPYLTEFCDNYAPMARGFLVPHAAEVILMTRIGSIRLATQYFSKKFGRNFSTKPINDIIAKVKKGEIVVTEAEIAAKAKCVPLAAQFVEKCPWMLNPKSSKSLGDEEGKKKAKEAASKKAAADVEAETMDIAEEDGDAVHAPLQETTIPENPPSSSQHTPEVLADINKLLDDAEAEDADLY